MSSKKETQTSAKGFTDEEQAAMKERASPIASHLCYPQAYKETPSCPRVIWKLMLFCRLSFAVFLRDSTADKCPNS